MPRRNKTKEVPPPAQETAVPVEQETDHAIKFEKRVGQYVQLREKIREMKARHELELEQLVDTQNRLTAWFTERLDLLGADSVKTKNGTAHRTTRYTASVQDASAFMDYVTQNQKWELLDKRANSTAVRAFVEEHKANVPGVNLSALRTIGVRAPTKS